MPTKGDPLFAVGHLMSYSRYAAIGDAKEVSRIAGASLHTQEGDPPQLMFYDDSRVPVRVVPSDVGMLSAQWS